MTKPETLLRTREVALALGVSVSTIKRWVDSGALRASRTVGKHRLIARSEAERFARLLGLSEGGLKLHDATEEGGDGALPDHLQEMLIDALCQGRLSEAKELIRSEYLTGCGAVALADLLIKPTMERIGHGWEVGSLDVYQEHEATQAVGAVLTELIGGFGREHDAAVPRAVGAAIEGDPYLLPGLLGELVLLERGWDVRNLGSNLPMRSLANAVLQYRPRLVFLSASHLTDEDRFVREFASFHRAAAGETTVLLGGRALGPALRARLAAADFGDRMADLAGCAQRLHTTERTDRDPISHTP